MTRSILPLAAMEKLLKQAGAPRVSEEAKEALKDILEAYSQELGKKAVKFSAHSGRKTIKASDVRLASNH